MKRLLLVLSITLPTPILSMAQSSNEKTFMKTDTIITTEFLQSFAEAFNTHDITDYYPTKTTILYLVLQGVNLSRYQGVNLKWPTGTCHF